MGMGCSFPPFSTSLCGYQISPSLTIKDSGYSIPPLSLHTSVPSPSVSMKLHVGCLYPCRLCTRSWAIHSVYYSYSTFYVRGLCLCVGRKEGTKWPKEHQKRNNGARKFLANSPTPCSSLNRLTQISPKEYHLPQPHGTPP